MQHAEQPKVFLVDDDESVTTGLSRLFRSVGLAVETFSSAEPLLQRERYVGPCCLVLDLNLENMTGLDVQRKLAESGRSLPIVFITGYGKVPDSVQAMKSGAVDFLMKPVAADELIAVVQSAIANDKAALSENRELTEDRRRVSALTSREREVAELVSQGLMNKEIAWVLGLSMATVKLHRGRVMEKLGVDSVAELVRILDRVGHVPSGQDSSNKTPTSRDS